MEEPPIDDVQEEAAEVNFERLSQSARDVLASAVAAAQRLGDDYVGTDHLLLGLSLTEHCAARNILESFDLTTDRLIETMHFIRGGQSNGASDTEMSYSPRLLRVLMAAGKDAKKTAHDEIGTIHILSGLLREGEGLAVFVLESSGLSNKRADYVLEFAAREGWSD